MNYEDKMRFLRDCKPEAKDILLLRILRGERKVPITGDEDLFFRVNRDRVSMEKFTNRDKFIPAAKATKQDKEGLYDPIFGKSKDKKYRWMGDIPAEIWFNRPEFSPLLSREERTKNIKKWLNDNPMFRAGEKRL